MLEILDQTHGDVVGVKVAGKLTDDDYQKVLIPKIEDILEREGSVRILMLFDGFSGWEARAAWDDAVFGLKHRKDFTRLALVGAPDYVEWGMRLFAPLMPGQTKSFASDQAAEAWAWIKADG